jgi:hypothetical protein
MTWVAACSGQRGIYQEVIMTDEERQKLCIELRRSLPFGYKGGPVLGDVAADEIERLTAANKELKKTLHHFLRERETDMGTAE